MCKTIPSQCNLLLPALAAQSVPQGQGRQTWKTTVRTTIFAVHQEYVFPCLVRFLDTFICLRHVCIPHFEVLRFDSDPMLWYGHKSSKVCEGIASNPHDQTICCVKNAIIRGKNHSHEQRTGPALSQGLTSDNPAADNEIPKTFSRNISRSSTVAFSPIYLSNVPDSQK